MLNNFKSRLTCLATSISDVRLPGKKIIFIPIGVALFLLIMNINNTINAQDVLDGVYVKEHVPAREPVPYHHLREADVIWNKKIWRMLDLKEKLNHPLYFPTTPMDDRYNLVDLIIYGVENEGLIVYNTWDDEFKVPMTNADIDDNLGAGMDTIWVDTVYADGTEDQVQKVVPTGRLTEQVTRLLIKEVWFFDKQRSKMEVRIIGLCPIRVYTRDVEEGMDEEELDLEMTKAFWVYFPALRNILANHEVFNPSNDAQRRTFDDIFFKRKFTSYIFKETNVYNNRSIQEFNVGLDALLEAEKIKKFIFTFEHDLWEY